MEQEEAAAFARRWVTAWNDRDVEAVLSHFADDAVFTSPLADRVLPGSGGVIRGKNALRDYWTEALRRRVGCRCQVHRQGRIKVRAREAGAFRSGQILRRSLPAIRLASCGNCGAYVSAQTLAGRLRGRPVRRLLGL
jgi:ketosteroid isomerase-like protein